MNVRKWFERLLGRSKPCTAHTIPAAPSDPSTAVPTPSPTAAVAKPPLDKPQRKQTKVVVVGIDFGTSGTKVVVGDTSTQRHYLLAAPKRPPRDSSFILPSVIQIRDDRVYFGADGPVNDDNVAEFTSFKVCLACQHGLAPCRGCAYRKVPGRFSFANSLGVDQLEAEHLATWFIAFVISRAKREIERRWGQHFVLQPLFNIGAPIDQWNAAKGVELFTRVAFYAEKLSATVADGAPLVDLLASYQEVRARYPQIPPEAERIVFVQPETAAGLMSFVTSPRVAGGLYGIVDVGAGTTDVSFFRLADFSPDEPRRMSFYDAKTDVVGAGDLDRRLALLAVSRLSGISAVILKETSPELLSAARIAKETLSPTRGCQIKLAAGTVKLSESEVETAFRPVIRQMVQTYVKTNHRAYKKERLVSHWDRFNMLMLGGGMRCVPVYEGFRTTYPSPYNKQIPFTRIPIPADLEGDASARENFELIAVAYGLSFSPLDFPAILSPSSVAPMNFDLPPKKMPDRDDLYPK